MRSRGCFLTLTVLCSSLQAQKPRARDLGDAFSRTETRSVKMLSNDKITPLFEATVQSVEEAIVNAMIAAETMDGFSGNKSDAIPHDKLIEVLKKCKRIDGGKR